VTTQQKMSDDKMAEDRTNGHREIGRSRQDCADTSFHYDERSVVGAKQPSLCVANTWAYLLVVSWAGGMCNLEIKWLYEA
jgi:hypothetical protein